MSQETVRKCDVCSSVMAEGSRRFVLRAALLGINGQSEEAATGGRKDAQPIDCCSAACVSTAVNELVRKVS